MRNTNLDLLFFIGRTLVRGEWGVWPDLQTVLKLLGGDGESRSKMLMRKAKINS